MIRTHAWVMSAALAIGGAAMVGCESHDHDPVKNPPPTDTNSRAGGTAAIGGDTHQPGEGRPTNTIGGNGGTMDMSGLH